MKIKKKMKISLKIKHLLKKTADMQYQLFMFRTKYLLFIPA